MARLFLGIDGGGSKCRARIRDEAGRLLGEGESGPSNIRSDFAGSVHAITEAASAALGAAGLPKAAAGQQLAGLSLAGVVGTGAAERLRSAGLGFAAMTVLNDAHAACLGAHGGGDGGIIVAGTGSAAYGIAGGRSKAIGGWGFELGDEGSGAIMGREAVRRAVLVIDGLAPATPLTAGILAELGSDLQTLAAWALAARPAHYARFAPQILAAAVANDPLAQDIVGAAAAALARLARGLLAFGAPRLSLLGGLAAAMLPRLPEEVRAKFVPPQADALDGAIMAARAAAGLPMALEGGGHDA
jgi:glucosamine kinase